MIEDSIKGHNQPLEKNLEQDFEALGETLSRRNIDIEKLTARAAEFSVAIPSWGVGTGGTRFARFPGPGEPEDVHDKLRDCAVINGLTKVTPRVSLHIPWDKVDDYDGFKDEAAGLGLGFDAMNSNTFQDQPGQEHSYKFGSLSHVDAAVRKQAIEHNLECIEIGQKLGSTALTVWIADGSNFPGQASIAKAFERYLKSMEEICASLPGDWRIYIEHKFFEPAFYSTVICDWGTSLMAANHLGDKAHCLVDLGHHAPNTNVEAIVARLLAAGKLGGFHFNDNNYGDDDIDSGSSNPYRLFLVFNEMEDFSWRGKSTRLDHMIDQSHNVTDPIESLACSAIEIQRAQVQAAMVDRDALEAHQQANDALLATMDLKRAFTTDVSPILAMARMRQGGAIDPIGCYRASGYREKVAKERKSQGGLGGGII